MFVSAHSLADRQTIITHTWVLFCVVLAELLEKLAKDLVFEVGHHALAR